MAHLYGMLTVEAAQRAVPTVWSDTETPLRACTRADWRAMFDYAGYTHDLRLAPRPTEDLILFRGAPGKYRRRWSWTADRSRAEWFAKRWDVLWAGEVWQAQAEPGRVLAYIGSASRDEDEYVVDTRGLKIRAASV